MSKSRRGRGEGTISQRPSGTWQAQISAGFNRAGKRIRITVTGKTKAEVRDKIARKIVSRSEGTLVNPDRITVESFLERWLLAIKTSVRGATYDSYKRYIDTHIKPAIGNVRLQSLDKIHVETMLDGMMRSTRENPALTEKHRKQKGRTIQPKQSASNRTKCYARAILCKALEYAVDDNLVPRNVARRVPAPSSERRKEMVVLNEDQVNKLLTQIRLDEGERYGRVYGLSVLTGMREGEYLALQWQDIDFKASPPVIHVRRTQSSVSGTVVLEKPKTDAGKRSIPLTQAAVDILKQQQAAMLKEGHIRSRFVFLDEQGQMLVRSGPVRSCLRRLLIQAELPRLSPHDLRHTHATLLLRAGVNPKVVQERLGHSDVAFTLRIYSHVLPDTQADAINKLDRLLG